MIYGRVGDRIPTVCRETETRSVRSNLKQTAQGNRENVRNSDWSLFQTPKTNLQLVSIHLIHLQSAIENCPSQAPSVADFLAIS
jgi:hypothetical protein